MRAALWLAVVAGCGTPSDEPFVIETTDCALVNSFTFDGQSTQWNDCRVYWSGPPTKMLTVELTNPATSGSFVMPHATWIRASLHVPNGEVQGSLRTTEHYGTLPPSLGSDQLALDMRVATCGNLGTSGLSLNTTAEVGDLSASFTVQISTICYRSGGQTMLSGGFIVSASAASSAAADPATIVTVP
jgi:hypothetical protein